MFIRILKRDLKRKKTMNIILLIFIILASMFVASGLNNVITVMNGTDYYLDKAGVGDYVIITQGGDAIGKSDEILKDCSCVDDYKIEPVLYTGGDSIKLADGEAAKTKNSSLIQSVDKLKLNYYDINNEIIKEVPQGHVYVSGSFLEDNDLEKGDKINITIGDVNMDLIVEGKAKDALLGSALMGNQRFILNDADAGRIYEDESLNENYKGEIVYVDTDDLEDFASVVTDIPSVAFDAARSMIKMGYVMDMIVAFIVLVLSICLIIVSFVVLKFSISFTIIEEFREIGVMKAIGISNRKIRGLYIGKYLLLSVLGAIVGFFASIPFGNMLLKSVSENMMLGNDAGYLINLVGTIVVILVIIAFAYHCTKKVKKSSPIDAIRSGQTGERYKKKSFYRIGNKHVSTNLYMSINDLLSSPKRFITIIISFMLCTLLVLIVHNTAATMESPNLAHTFSSVSDLYVMDAADSMELEYMTDDGREKLEKSIREKEILLKEADMPARICVDVQYKYTISFEDREYKVTCQQGIGTKADDYEYTKGEAPRNRDEIAITEQISEMTGAKIGDVVTIDFGDEEMECMVTAYFQSMNQMGEIVRLNEDAPTDFEDVSCIMQYQINFTDSPSDEKIDSRKDKVKEILECGDVLDATEYCVKCIGVVETMKSVESLLVVITLVVVILVTILMERSFIADETSQIAILKAIGFSDRDIIKWHVGRFGIVAVLSVVLAAVVSIPMTKLCITPIFSMMGASEVEYNIDVLSIFVIYPVIFFIVTVVVAWITSLYTKKITSRDTANLE